MELNEMLESKLTKEQKSKFHRDVGKYKLIRNIVVLPIATTIIGIYFESAIVVTISMICIIAFLAATIYLNTTFRKDVIYDEVILPYVIGEKFSKVEVKKRDYTVEEEYNKSQIVKDYTKFDANHFIEITEDKYKINLCKVVTKKMEVEKNDGVVDKNLEENFNGIFAYIKLPQKFGSEFSVVDNVKEVQELYSKEAVNTQYIKMNNIEFDKQYDVYSMDQVTVRKILSPGAMARIMEINRKMGNVISFSVYSDVLYMTINYKDFLRFKDNKRYVDENRANENLEILELMNYFITYFINLIQI